MKYNSKGDHKNQEQNQPNEVHEMPIFGKEFYAHFFKWIGQHDQMLYLIFFPLAVLHHHDQSKNHRPNQVKNMDTTEHIQEATAR